MLKRLFDKFFKNTLYIKIGRETCSIRSVEQNHTLEDEPLLASVSGKNGERRIVAIGSEAVAACSAGAGTVSICYGFDNNSAIADFDVAQTIVTHFISQVLPSKALVRPIIVLQPLGRSVLSPTEVEAFFELAISAGARDVYVWVGRELQHHELAGREFPVGEGLVYTLTREWVESRKG